MFSPSAEQMLKEKVIPFWEALRDEARGGYYGFMDSLTMEVNQDAVKGCILNSRILWFFSKCYLRFHEANLLDDARLSYEFLKKAALDPVNGGVFWSMTADGQPADDTKHTYNQAFAIYGLSAYYEASGDQEALQLAYRLFHIIEDKCRDANGYLEAFSRDFKPASNEKLSENGVMATRTMNTLLHVFEGYSELYAADHNPEVADRLTEILNLWLKKMYNPALERQEVFFDSDYNTLIDLHSYGHDIEGSWLIWDAVQTLLPESEQAPYREMCKVLGASVYERAWTDHGLKNECVDGEVNELRIWWVQAETILGFANAYALTGEEKYKQAVIDEWDYIQKVIVDPREGSEWFWCTEEDGTPTIEKPIVEEWKCPYHNGRMCLRMIETAEA